ncbi:transcription initiation factor TFIID subunit, partial [Thraustotheca clavata]
LHDNIVPYHKYVSSKYPAVVRKAAIESILRLFFAEDPLPPRDESNKKTRLYGPVAAITYALRLIEVDESPSIRRFAAQVCLNCIRGFPPSAASQVLATWDHAYTLNIMHTIQMDDPGAFIRKSPTKESIATMFSPPSLAPLREDSQAARTAAELMWSIMNTTASTDQLLRTALSILYRKIWGDTTPICLAHMVQDKPMNWAGGYESLRRLIEEEKRVSIQSGKQGYRPSEESKKRPPSGSPPLPGMSGGTFEQLKGKKLKLKLGETIVKPSTLLTRFKMDDRSETLVQQLQERNSQLAEQIASKNAQSNELHKCITALNKELRLTVDQLNQFKQANAEKDHEIITLRAHVDDLYQVQLQLRSESLQYKVELKKRPSQTVSEISAIDSPMKNEMASGIGETLDCLQREMAALEAHVESKEPSLNMMNLMEQWYQLLNPANEEITNNEDKIQIITKSLEQLLEKSASTNELQQALELSEKQCSEYCHELRLLEMQSELQSCYWISDSFVDDEKIKLLQDQLHELATKNEILSKSAVASAAKCKLWETQYNAIQIELEKVGERWESAQSAMDEEREAMETKLFNTCVHVEQLESLLSDFQSSEEVELIDQFTQCDLLPNEFTSPIKATSQWISVIDAMQANHEVEMEVLRNDITIVERELSEKDAEIEQLNNTLENTNAALGELHIRQDLISQPSEDWVNFAETTGGRLISLVCDDFVFVNSSCQTDTISSIDQVGNPHELNTKLEQHGKELKDYKDQFQAAAKRERQLQCELLTMKEELIAAENAIAAKNQELVQLLVDLESYKQKLKHLNDCNLTAYEKVHDLNQMEKEDIAMQLIKAKNRVTKISKDFDALQSKLNLQSLAYNALDSQHRQLLLNYDEKIQHNHELAMEVEDFLGQLYRGHFNNDMGTTQLEHKATNTDNLNDDKVIDLDNVEIVINNVGIGIYRSQVNELLLLADEDRRSQLQAATEIWCMEKLLLEQKYNSEKAQLQQSLEDTKQSHLTQCDTFQQLVSRQEQCIQSMKEEKLVLSRHFESKVNELSDIVGPAKLLDGDALGTKLGQYHTLVSKLLMRYQECNDHLLHCQTNQDSPEVDTTNILHDANNKTTQNAECQVDLPFKLPKKLVEMGIQTLFNVTESFDEFIVLEKELANKDELSTFVPKFNAIVSKLDLFKQDNDQTIVQILISVLESTKKVLDSKLLPCKEKSLEISCWDATESILNKAFGTHVEPQGCVIIIIGAFEIQAGIVRKQEQSIPDLRIPTSAINPSGQPLYEHGVLVNFKVYEQVLHQIFELLHIQPAMYKLILLHKPSISPLEKERLVTIALESCCVPSVNLTTHAQAALLSNKIHTALGIDFGVDTIFIVPIYEDMVLDHAVVKLDISTTIEWHKQSNEKHHFDHLLHPNGSNYLMNGILKSLALCDQDIHASLLQDVVLTGGCAHDATLSHHMSIELHELISAIDTIPSSTIPHVHIVANIYHGANLHANIVSSFKWISFPDYQIEGPPIVHTRCF